MNKEREMKYSKIAAAVLVNEDGKILIMKRSPKRKRHSAYWGLPAGVINENESLEEAAKREVFEETGIKVGNLKRGLTLQVNDNDFVGELTYFLAEVKNETVRINDEHTEYKWVLPKESVNYKYAVGKESVKHILASFGLL